MLIAETSAPTLIGIPFQEEIARKQAWWRQLYSTQLAAQFPKLRMINWFEFTKYNKYYGLFTNPIIGRQFVKELPPVMVYS